MDTLYTNRTPASLARKRAAIRQQRDGQSQAGRVARGGVGSSAQARTARRAAEKQATANREPRTSTKAKTVQREGLYDQNSPANRARGRAGSKARSDAAKQAARVARGGVGSSAAAQKRAGEKQRTENREPRTSTKAKEVQREGLYDQNSPANRARGRAADKAGKDAANQRQRDVTSPENAAEKQRQKAEAAEKKKQAEAQAKALEAKAKTLRAEAENLKGKAKREARAEAEALEAKAKSTRQETKTPAPVPEPGQPTPPRQTGQPSQPGQPGQPSQPPAPPPPISATTQAPTSAPPLIRNAAQALQQASTAQAWDELETQLKTL